jgi:hypothetical protein
MAVQLAKKLCSNIPDEVCRYCPQYWTECRASIVPMVKEACGQKLFDKSAAVCRPSMQGDEGYQLPFWS